MATHLTIHDGMTVFIYQSSIQEFWTPNPAETWRTCTQFKIFHSWIVLDAMMLDINRPGRLALIYAFCHIISLYYQSFLDRPRQESWTLILSPAFAIFSIDTTRLISRWSVVTHLTMCPAGMAMTVIIKYLPGISRSRPGERLIQVRSAYSKRILCFQVILWALQAECLAIESGT
jgi:hypothetical protein